MAACAFFEKCRLFTEENASGMPKLVSMFKQRYCLGNFDQCARYRVAREVGRRHVPEFMLPTQIEWAQQIIKEQKEDLKIIEKTQTSSTLPKM